MTQYLIENPTEVGDDEGVSDNYNFVTVPAGAPLIGFFTRNNEPLFPPVSCKECACMILIHLLDTSQVPDDAGFDLLRKVALSTIRDDHSFSPEVLWMLIM